MRPRTQLVRWTIRSSLENDPVVGWMEGDNKQERTALTLETFAAIGSHGIPREGPISTIAGPAGTPITLPTHKGASSFFGHNKVQNTNLAQNQGINQEVQPDLHNERRRRRRVDIGPTLFLTEVTAIQQNKIIHRRRRWLRFILSTRNLNEIVETIPHGDGQLRQRSSPELRLMLEGGPVFGDQES